MYSFRSTPLRMPHTRNQISVATGIMAESPRDVASRQIISWCIASDQRCDGYRHRDVVVSVVFNGSCLRDIGVGDTLLLTAAAMRCRHVRRKSGGIWEHRHTSQASAVWWDLGCVGRNMPVGF